MKKYTTESFIEKAKEIHGNDFNYDLVNYKGIFDKIELVCNKCGTHFMVSPHNHLNGTKCPNCNWHSKKYTTESFIEKARQIHGDKYNYSKVDYHNYDGKVCIICPEHGEFWQTPHNHLNGQGCPYCYGHVKMTSSSFIEKAKQVHGDKYDYSKVEYIDSKTKVCIICPEHGEFWQKPADHLKGHGCYKCSVDSRTWDLDQFIERAKQVYGDKYDYSKVEYSNSKSKILIKCNNCGKEFWITPSDHLRRGCPFCEIPKGEKKIMGFLEEHKIKFVYNEACLDWLVYKQKMKPDFYLPEYNTIIEFDGAQHFIPVEYFGGEETLQNIQERDKIKNQLCEEHGISVIRIPYTEFDNINEILSNYFD